MDMVSTTLTAIKEVIMAKRDIILAKILEGGATKESLMEAAEVNDKGLASQMTYLRLMGTCPRKMDDGTYEIITREEWDEHRASSGSRSDAKLTPTERIEKAEKKVGRAATALDKATKFLEADPDSELKALKFQVAKASLKIAEIEQGEIEVQFREAADAEAEEVETAGDDELE